MTGTLDRLKDAIGSRYVIESKLGSGGMAEIFLAEDVKHSRKVAVKVLRPDLSFTLGAERFLREIKIAANLTHPHILPLHDSGMAGGLLYYVMPYFDGESLAARLSREPVLPLADALQIVWEVAAALDYAHRRDIVHRDIKPGNILLADGHAVVADFGIARAISAAGGNSLTQYLERAFGEEGWSFFTLHRTFLLYMRVGAWFDPLRSDPRFDTLLERMKFPI